MSNLITSKSISSCLHLGEILVFTSVTHLFLRVPLNGALFFPTGIHLFDDFQFRLYFFRITFSIDFDFILLFSFLQFCTIIDISSLTSLHQSITNIPYHIRQMRKYQEHNNNHKSKAICCSGSNFTVSVT